MSEPIKVTSAGRTDAGVHATGQVISFKTTSAFPIERLAIAFNSRGPEDVTMRYAEVTRAEFSARFDAHTRTYVYRILNRPMASAVMRRFAHHVYHALDLDAMREGARGFVGEHDFLSCCGVLPDSGPTIRTLKSIDIERREDLVSVRVVGDGFLHRMVRIITGTLIEMGSGRRDPASTAALLSAKDRRAAGYTAPAQGLFFAGVEYDDFSSLRAPDFG